MSKNPTQPPEEDPNRIPHRLISLLACAQLLRYEVLDKVEIDRQEIVHIADNIEQHVMDLVHLVLGADIDEWKAEWERKRAEHDE
jgi:hypothetical protein